MNTLSKLVKSTTPEYTAVLPISKKKVTFRPFKVKEEKVLLMAIEDGSENAILRAIINIIEACCDDIGDAGDLQTLDIEYIFIQLRSKSLGDIVEPIITCPFTDEKKQVKINLTKIKILKQKEKLSNKIKISEDAGITFKLPSINIILKHELGDIENLGVEDSLKVIALCMDEIWTSTEVVNANNISLDEKIEFLEDLMPDVFETIVKYFENTPKLGIKVKYKTSDEEEREITLSGLQDFFG